MAETQHDPPIEESLLQAVFQSLDNRHLNQTISALDGPTLKALVDRANEQEQAGQLLEPLSKKNLAKVLSTDFPAASAELLQQLPEKNQVRLLQKLSPTLGATILERFPDDRASRIFEMLVDRQLDTSVSLIKKLRTDTWVDLVQSLSPAHRSLVLEALEPKDYSVAEELMSFSPETAGGLMHKEFIAIHGRFTTADIVRHLRRHARKYSGYFTRYFFVVGAMNDLEGVVSLEQILFGEAKQRVKELAKEISLTVEPTESADHLVRLFRTHGFAAIPVVDEERKLLGIVTQDTALKHAETSSEGKLLKMAGIVAGEEFRDMPFRARSWNRLSWLSVNIFLNLLAASVIAAHTDVIQAVVVLAVFLPIISDMSGCAGNQAIAVSIRELSLERLKPEQFLQVLKKECSVGIVNGLILGLLIGSIAFLWYDRPILGVVVGLSLWLNTFFAVCLGGLTPLGLRKMGKDPALASGPILTTLTDLCGFLILLTLASHLLR